MEREGECLLGVGVGEDSLLYLFYRIIGIIWTVFIEDFKIVLERFVNVFSVNN